MTVISRLELQRAIACAKHLVRDLERAEYAIDTDSAYTVEKVDDSRLMADCIVTLLK